MLGTIIVLLRGIPFIYQGQEIGMTNTRFEDISEYDDINTINEYNLAIEAGKTKEEAMDICYKHSRDNGRTPMQWSDEKMQDLQQVHHGLKLIRCINIAM